MKTLILSLLIFNLTWAACNKPVTYLTEGSTTLCTGYLFSPEKELEVRIKVENFDNIMEIKNKQNELIDILNQRVKLAQDQNMKLEQYIQERQNMNWYINIGFFIAGALLTGYIASNVNK